MNLSKEQLEDVTSLAKLGFCIEDISIIIEVERKPLENDFMSKGEFYRAYKKGQLLAEKELRESVFKLANMGHVAAQKNAQQFLTEQRIKDE